LQIADCRLGVVNSICNLQSEITIGSWRNSNASARHAGVVGAIPTGLTNPYGCRLTVGHEALTLAIVVRIHTPVPKQLQIVDFRLQIKFATICYLKFTICNPAVGTLAQQ
jgi:hypothetical protein